MSEINNAAETVRPRIRELRLRRFRAFEDARLFLDDLTVVVGRNGSGKSTLMEAFDFLQDAVMHSLLTALERRGGINNIVHRPSSQRQSNTDVEIAIDLALPVTNVLYGFTLAPFRSRSGFQVKQETLKTYPKESFSFHREGRDFVSQIRGAKPRVGRESLVLPLVAEHEEVWKMTLDVLARLLVYSFSPQDMQAEPRIGSQQALVRDGSNIGDVLRQLDDDKSEMDWIMRHLASVTRGITHIQASAAAGRRTVTFFQQTGKRESRFAASDMSHGTLHSLGVLVALRQKPVPSLVFVDEIEASVHTAALAALMDAAKASSKERCQVIISSHSTDALSHNAVNAENVRIVDWQDDRSFVFHVGEGARELLEPPETVGRLLRSNALWTEDQPKTVTGDIFGVMPDVSS